MDDEQLCLSLPVEQGWVVVFSPHAGSGSSWTDVELQAHHLLDVSAAG